LTTLQIAIAEMQAARERIKTLAQEQGRPIILAAAQPLFDMGVDAIRWRQYTPYFNDGDACEFSVNDPAVRFAGDEESGDYEDGFNDAWSLTYGLEKGYFTPPDGVDVAQVSAALKEFASMICTRDAQDFMEDLFGDHVTVTIRRPVAAATIEVEDYNHD
jgi:hypothetical protein